MPHHMQIVTLTLAVIFGAFGVLRWMQARRERSERESEEQFRRTIERMRSPQPPPQRDAARLLAKRRPRAQSGANSHLFALPGWVHEVPVPLEELVVKFSDPPDPPVPMLPTKHLPRAIVPFSRFSDCIKKLAPPTKFENYPHYRLLFIGPRTLEFSRTPSRYFQRIDFGQYLEYAWLRHADLSRPDQAPSIALWKSVSQPRDYAVLAGVNTLTLLHDGTSLRFLMHQRGVRDTAYAMGRFHVIPAGEFQPACEHPPSFSTDLDIWKCMMREYGEELGSVTDYDGGSNVPFNYGSAPHSGLNREREAGNIRVFYFGTGLDPVSLQGEILTVAVFKERTFLDLFPKVLQSNREGKINTAGDRWGHPFTEEECETYTHLNSHASGRLLLTLALRNREMFLDVFRK
jgi:hypothetical protein